MTRKESTAEKTKASLDAPPVPPSLSRSLLLGGLGFGLASLLVFATVAFAERWMYQTLGLAGAYANWTSLFILLGGGALSPLVVGPNRGWRFFLIFTLAFAFYAVGWISANFSVRGVAGEWLGSLIGSTLMGLVLAIGFRALRTVPVLIGILIVANSAGYFLGSLVSGVVGRPLGMLLWGVLYGVFLGAGLGASLHLAQTAASRKKS
jgi:hypothetical protein